MLERTKIGNDRAAEGIPVGNKHSADVAAFEIGPHKFVGIQFGRVSGQEEELQSTIQGFDKTTGRFRSMGRMTVDDAKDWMFGVVHEPAEKFTEAVGVYGPFDHHESQLPLWTDRGKHIQAETLSGHGHHGRAASRSPGRSRMKVGSNTRLVLEKYRGALLAGERPDPRKLPAQPLLYQRPILLERTVEWLLASETELSQESPYGRAAQLYAEMSPDHDRDHLARPQCKGKPQLQRILLRDCLVDPSDLRSGQLLRPPGNRLCRQRVPPAIAVHRQPVINRCPTEAECSNHHLRALACLHLSHRSSPDLFQCLVIQPPPICLTHALLLSLSQSNVNL